MAELTVQIPDELAERLISSEILMTFGGLLTGSNADPRAGTIFPVFLFPDGSVVLQGVNRELTGRKRLAPMGTTHRHQDTNFPNFQLASAVVNHHVGDISPALANLRRDLFEHLQGHRFVGLILQTGHRSPVRVIPHHATHDHDRPIARIVRQAIHLLQGQGRKGHGEVVSNGGGYLRGKG